MPQPEKTPFDVSELVRPLPRRRYWLLFQSWRQLGSYALTVAISALSLQILALLAGVRMLPTPVVLGLLAVGGLVFVRRVIPVRFTISPSSEHAVARVIEELTYLRYVEMGVQDNAVVYRKGRLPRILLWEEGHIRLTRDGDDLVVNGPSSNAGAIRKHLSASK